MGMVLMFHQRKGRCSIMKRTCLSFLLLTFVTATVTDVLLAQYGDEYCLITLKGENRNRTVDGAIDKECKPFGAIGHTPPWGNWGVASNYGNITDTDQFRGWKHKGGPLTKLQWNSCTTQVPFSLKNCIYYNAPGPEGRCSTQASSAVVTHGTMSYRTAVTPCFPLWWRFPTPPGYYPGCGGQRGDVSQASNHMTLYELEGDILGTGIRVDRHDLIETLYFPGTSVTLTGCTYDGCPEKTSDWVRMTSSTSSTAKVEAELRMKASAKVYGNCPEFGEW